MKEMKHLFQKYLHYLRQSPGLSSLVVILIIIYVVSLKPQFYIIGWDNYSSYFNLQNNIFRTLFATWREYRGLGVPSDSEIVDIFRQLFFYSLHFVIPPQLLDQFYFLFCLTLGTLGMYGFIKKIFAATIPHVSRKILDMVSATGAFFYLFNLNTLSIFYFPIVTYVTRYAAIPILFGIFFSLMTSEKMSRWKFIRLLLVISLSSGSYITGTVFITTLLSLVIFGFIWLWNKRYSTAFCLFIGLNMFWLLVFGNYTLEKSSIIKLAPTFIDANETQLNKPQTYYALSKQLILYPNFFETTYHTVKDTIEKTFHHLADTYNIFPDIVGIYIFPVLYIWGSLEILLGIKRYRYLSFIPLLIGLFLFLSLKEYSFLGFFYKFLDQNIPYFGVLFRFGDTKFHPYIAFAGSIAVSVAVLKIISLIKPRNTNRTLLVGIIGGLVILFTLISYRSYFLGHLVGSFVYSRIPHAYSDIARDINADPDFGRVLHLPYDEKAYWRSYTWGYLGSAFFQYLLDKPLMEKTFEPGSQENADFNTRISNIFQNVQVINPGKDLNFRATTFYDVLKMTGVKYVVLDNTVSQVVDSRGVKYWGRYPYYDAKLLLNTLVSLGLAIQSQTYPIDDSEYIYAAIRNEKNDGRDRPVEDHQLALYTLVNVDPPISFINEVQRFDEKFINRFQFPNRQHFLQQMSVPGILIPFGLRDGELALADGNVKYTISQRVDQNSILHVPVDENNGEIEIYGRNEKDSLVLSFYEVIAPSINDNGYKMKLKEVSIPHTQLKNGVGDISEYKSFLSDWHVLGDGQIGNMRIAIDDVMVPIPAILQTFETYIGSVMVHSHDPTVSLFLTTKIQNIDSSAFSLTDNPNCFGDKLDNYDYKASHSGSFLLSSSNGSTCAVVPLVKYLDKKTDYLELSLKVRGENSDSDWQNLPNSIPRTLKKIASLPKPNIFHICLKLANGNDCSNRHQMMTLGSLTEVRVPYEQTQLPDKNIVLLTALKNLSYQQQKADVMESRLYQFQQIASDSFTLVTNQYKHELPAVDNKVQLSWKPAVSRTSFYFNPAFESFIFTNQACEQRGYRTTRFVQDRILSGVENCYNEMSERVPFDSSRFTIWSIAYSLLSGKYPQFIMKDKNSQYVDEYVSVYQGYPDIRGFRNLQQAELLSKDKILRGIVSAPLVNAYTYIYPQKDIQDLYDKEYIIHQNSQNAGMFTISGYQIMDIPTYWKDIQIVPPNSTQEYQIPTFSTYQKLLPSLWKLQIQSSGNTLIKFNSGYDRQWLIYDSLLGVITGIGRSYPSIKCDGYANCFEISSSQQKKTYYIFYSPERLNFLGWIGTLLSIAGVGFFWKRFPLRSS